MKFYFRFFIISIFINVSCFTQTKKHDNAEERINKKIKKAIKLYQNYQFKKALKITKQCIKESDSIKNDSLLGKSYIVNGIVYTYLNKEQEAIVFHRKAEAIFAKTKYYKMIGLAYHNIAFAYNKNNKNIDSAIVYYKKALSIYDRIGNTKKMAVTANNLGHNYLEIDKLEDAEIYFKKAIALSKIHNIPKVLCRAHKNHGIIYYKKNDLQEALKALNASQKISEKENYEDVLVNIFKLKSEVLEKMGDIKNAHKYLKKHNKHRAHTHKVKKSILIQEASVKYEVKENKALLEKIKLENTSKENELKKTCQVIFFILILFLTSTIASLLLYKNNTLKVENNKLLVLKNEKLKELQQETELNFLKAQIQPDFFFNTLTILHTLILKKSKNAKDVVLKLSELMQYSIYQAKKENVSIWDEINNIQNYLELERLYNRQKSFPTIQIHGNIDAIKVPPLLYFSFIKNYFKSDNIRNKNIELLISFNNLGNDQLVFNIKNNINSPDLKNETTNELDIKNIRRRLNLIYKDKYSLVTKNVNNTFDLILKTPV